MQRSTYLTTVVLVVCVSACSGARNTSREDARIAARDRDPSLRARSNEGADERASEDVVADGDRGALAGDITYDGYAPSRSFAYRDMETARIGAAPAESWEPRPRTKGRIDIDLKVAPLGNALRFIASSGGFNLVMEGDPDTPITVELHHVDPYDALVAVAEAQGFEVAYERGIVRVVTPGAKPK